jgi:hypothetical protein
MLSSGTTYVRISGALGADSLSSGQAGPLLGVARRLVRVLEVAIPGHDALDLRASPGEFGVTGRLRLGSSRRPQEDLDRRREPRI